MDRSRGSLVITLVAIGFLTGAALLPWLEYEHSSGRNTSPDGPYGEEKMADRQSHTLGALPGHGDLEPDNDQLWQRLVLGLLAGSALLLLLALFGDLPGLHRIMPRTVSLILQSLAWASSAGALVFGWFYMPNSLAAYGVDSAFTYFLIEPDGYTRTTLSFGWILAGLAFLTVPVAWIQKFQAGSDDPTDVEAYRA